MPNIIYGKWKNLSNMPYPHTAPTYTPGVILNWFNSGSSVIYDWYADKVLVPNEYLGGPNTTRFTRAPFYLNRKTGLHTRTADGINYKTNWGGTITIPNQISNGNSLPVQAGLAFENEFVVWVQLNSGSGWSIGQYDLFKKTYTEFYSRVGGLSVNPLMWPGNEHYIWSNTTPELRDVSRLGYNVFQAVDGGGGYVQPNHPNTESDIWEAVGDIVGNMPIFSPNYTGNVAANGQILQTGTSNGAYIKYGTQTFNLFADKGQLAATGIAAANQNFAQAGLWGGFPALILSASGNAPNSVWLGGFQTPGPVTHYPALSNYSRYIDLEGRTRA